MLKMTSSFLRNFICIIILTCIVSCGHREVYYNFDSIPNNVWNKTQAVSFVLDSTTISKLDDYDFNIELIHNTTYPYTNLFLLVDYTLNDSLIRHDTIEFILTDTFGRWKGRGNGPIRQLSMPYKTALKINPALQNKFEIRHAMQDSRLKGIEKVGLKIY